MVDTLTARTPLCYRLPVTHGQLTATECAPERVTLIAPFKSYTGPLDLPQPGLSTPHEGGLLTWAGHREWMLFDAPVPTLPDAAIVDLTDGWVWLDLTGVDWAEALMRICPVDPVLLGNSATARSDVGHMAALLISLPDGIRIGTLRSFAGSLADTVEAAMASIAAQAAL